MQEIPNQQVSDYNTWTEFVSRLKFYYVLGWIFNDWESLSDIYYFTY